MRVLIISDVHANLTALEEVLADAEQVEWLGKTGFDTVWSIGDIVGYGPYPNQCIQRLKQFEGHLRVAGNHDWAALGRLDIRTFNADARKAVGWTRETLTDENLAFLEALPITFVLGDFTLAHGSPREPVWEYILDPLIAALNFSYYQTPYCLVGHTHTPVIFRMASERGECDAIAPEYNMRVRLNGSRQIINPGSVGQPRDSDPRASYAILDVDSMTWEYRRIPYDFKLVQQRMERSDMPERLINRLEHGW